MPSAADTQPDCPASPPPEPPPIQFRDLGPAGPLAVAAAFLPAVGGIVLLGSLNVAGPWLRDHGPLGLAIYILAFAICSGFAILPTWVQALLGGWAFGFSLGFPAALLGFMGGAGIGYIIARTTASDRVALVIDQRPKWAAVRDALIGGSFWKTLGIVALIRLPPNSPFALTNLVMGSARVSPLVYFLGALAMAPRTAAAVFLAAGLHDLSVHDARESAATPRWLLVAGIAAAAVAVITIGYIANRAIQRVAACQASSSNPQPTA